MKKIMLTLVLATGTAISIFAAPWNGKEWNENVSKKLYANRVAKDAKVLADVQSYIDTIELTSDGQRNGVVGAKKCIYVQTQGADTSFTAIKAYVDKLIAEMGYEIKPDGVNYLNLIYNHWAGNDPVYCKAAYDYARATDGWTKWYSSVSVCRTLKKYAEAYDLAYTQKQIWNALYIAQNNLADMDKAFAAAKLVTTKDCTVGEVKNVLKFAIGNCVGNDVVDQSEVKDLLSKMNRKYSSKMVLDKETWEPVIGQIRETLRLM